jgi:hypothetical protein
MDASMGQNAAAGMSGLAQMRANFASTQFLFDLVWVPNLAEAPPRLLRRMVACFAERAPGVSPATGLSDRVTQSGKAGIDNAGVALGRVAEVCHDDKFQAAHSQAGFPAIDDIFTRRERRPSIAEHAGRSFSWREGWWKIKNGRFST